MCVWKWVRGSGNSTVHLLKIPVAKWNTQAELSNGSQMLFGLLLRSKVGPRSFLPLLIGLWNSDWGASIRAICLTLLYGKCQKINAGHGNKVELDLICPRPLRLICTPPSEQLPMSWVKKKCTAHSGCYGILSYNNLTSQRRKTVFICCLTLWKP